MTPWPLDSLVDEHTGVIRRVREVLRPEGAPDAYVSLTAEVADARRLGEWPADRVSLGTTFGDRAQARIAAIAEACERYCGNLLPEDLPEGTRRQLREQGRDVVELEGLPRFAPWQLEREGFEYEDLAEDTPALWAPCRERLPDGGERDVLAPASLVYLNWRLSRWRHLPRVHHLNYAGIATGQGFEDAVSRALYEVAERDALEVWWHLDGPADAVDPASLPGVSEAMRGCELEWSVVVMPSEFAPAMAALVRDPATGLFAAGFAAKPTAEEAARKAVLEAVHTWIYTKGTASADGWVFEAIEAGLMAKGLHLEHRADGRYLDSAGEHMRRVRDLGAHVQLWQDERLHALERRWSAPGGGTVRIEDVPDVPAEELRRRIAASGRSVIVKDLTTPDVRPTGLAVARVIVPHLVPNAPAAFGYYGMPRYRQAAESRGWRVPGGPEDLLLAPAPHM